MDGLLIDSEPLWQEAGQEVLSLYDIQLTDEQYHSSTGLRTPEWIDYWFSYHQIDKLKAPEAIEHIEETALQKIRPLKGKMAINTWHSLRSPVDGSI